MKMTLDLPPSLMSRLCEVAKREAVTPESLAEEGLRRVVAERYNAMDGRSEATGRATTVGGYSPPELFTWENMRTAAYGDE